MPPLSRFLLALVASLSGCSVADRGPRLASWSATVLAPAQTRPAWVLHRYGSDGFDSVAAIAAMPDGGLVIAGHFEGELDLGSGDHLVSAGETDAFIAVLDRHGRPSWAAQLGGAGLDAATAVVVDDHGNPILVGDLSGPVRAGSRRLAPRGKSDVFAAGFGADGALRWATTVGGPGWDTAAAATLLTGGDLAIAGTSGLTGRSDAIARAGDADVLVARIGPRGAVRWTRRFGGDERDDGLAIADHGGGDLAVAGSFGGRLRADDVTLLSAGLGDGFLVRLGADGVVRRAERLGGAGDDAVTALAIARDGSTALAGYFGGRIALGAARLDSAGDSDVFVARTDPAGEPKWAIRHGGAGADAARALVALPDGSLLAAATYSLALDLVAGEGPSEVVLHRIDASGRRRDLFRVSGFLVSARALAATAGGTAALAGSFAGRAHIMGRVIDATDALDGFIVTAPLAGAGE